MGMTMRVSLPGYDVTTDGTVSHYSIYADGDNVLIKEKVRGSGNLDSPGDGTVSHNLGYIPFFIVYNETATDGEFTIAQSYSPSGPARWWQVYTGTADLRIANTGGTDDRDYKYFIFYDDMS
jgi:hypothetical protein